MFSETLEVLKLTQQACDAVVKKHNYSFEDVTGLTRKYFFASFYPWFPGARVKELGEERPRAIRHRIVMALTGMPIEQSQTELDDKIWRTVANICRDDSQYLTKGISLEIQNVAESNAFGLPWSLTWWAEQLEADSKPKSKVDVPDLQQYDFPF